MIRFVTDVFRTPDPRPETPMAKATRDVKDQLMDEAKKHQLKTAHLRACALKSKAALLQDDISNEEVLRILEQTEDRLNNAKTRYRYNALAYLKSAIANRHFAEIAGADNVKLHKI